MESIVKNSIAGRLEEAENFYPRCPITRKLKTKTQVEHVRVEARIRTLDIGIGQMPEAIMEIHRSPIVEKIFNPRARLQNKLKRSGYFPGFLKPFTPGTSHSTK